MRFYGIKRFFIADCGADMDFESLLKRISPKLKGITYNLNRGYSSFDKEDLFQEALVHLWRDFNAYKLEDKTDSYILQGCYYYLKNYIRKIDKSGRLVSLQRFIDNEDNLTLEDALLLQAQDPQEYFYDLNNKLLADTLYNNGFTEREKHILLFCSQGLTTRQMGEKLGISHVRVVKLISEIRNKAKQYLD